MIKSNELNNQSSSHLLKQERIWELDFIRGLCVALMIIDHLLFDLGFIFLDQWFLVQNDGGFIYSICNFAHDIYWDHPLRLIIRTLVLIGFIGSCGISCSLSKSNLRRGIKLLLVALALSAVTFAIDTIMDGSSLFISFGILHMLSISILVYAGLSRFGFWPSLLIGSAIVIISFFINTDFTNSGGFALYILGLNNAYNSADYFPLIPYLGWFLVGAAVGSRLYKQKRSFFPNKGKSRINKPIFWLGRHALLVYILHQPLIYLLLLLLGIIFT
jgi:uncharacterized membrane protein